MFLKFAFFAFLGITYALPSVQETGTKTEVSTRNNALEQIALELLEELRETMVNGADGIPVLDPLDIDHVRADLGSLGFPNSHVEISNAALRNLSTFIVDDLRITLTSVLLQRYTVEFDGGIPILEMDANNYDLNVFAGGFNLFGNGNVKIRLVEPRLKGTVLVGLRLIPVGLNIISADVSLALTGFESKFNGMFEGDNFVNEFVDSFLGYLIPDLVEMYEEDISKILNDVILEVGNEILANIDIGSIIGGERAAKIEKALIDPNGWLR